MLVAPFWGLAPLEPGPLLVGGSCGGNFASISVLRDSDRGIIVIMSAPHSSAISMAAMAAGNCFSFFYWPVA